MGCLAVAGLVYAHFVYEVVGDICEFYDIKLVEVFPPTPTLSISFPATLARPQSRLRKLDANFLN